MKVNINQLLEQSGKTKYWLSKATNITYPNIMKLCNEEIPPKTIKLETLDKICTALKCNVQDILENEIDGMTQTRLKIQKIAEHPLIKNSINKD